MKRLCASESLQKCDSEYWASNHHDNNKARASALGDRYVTKEHDLGKVTHSDYVADLGYRKGETP